MIDTAQLKRLLVQTGFHETGAKEMLSLAQAIWKEGFKVGQEESKPSPFWNWLDNLPSDTEVTALSAWNAGFAAGIESRLNQNTVSIEAPSQEPAFFVVTGKLGHRCAFTSTTTKKGDKVYPEPPDAAAQIASLNESLNAADDYRVEAEELIAKLQAENDQLKSDLEDVAEFKRLHDECNEAMETAIKIHKELQAENDSLKRIARDNRGTIDAQKEELHALRMRSPNVEIARLQAEKETLNRSWKESAELLERQLRQEIDLFKVCDGERIARGERIEQLTAAARMTIDCWECEQMLTDAVLIQLHDALGDSHDL